MRGQAKRGFPLWPWVLLLMWVAVIWGHSLMSGAESSAESGLVVEFLRRVVYRFELQGNPFVMRLVSDPEFLHHVVRKTAHFGEYFVLGMLTFNAVRLTFLNPLLGAIAIAGLWMGVPSIDETIQRFTPERAGQLSDVLLDMSGFACSLALCLLWSLLTRKHRTS